MDKNTPPQHHGRKVLCSILAPHFLRTFAAMALTLQANAAEDEKSQGPRHRIKMVASTPNKQEEMTQEVKSSLHPGYEKYILYCIEKEIDCNLTRFKRQLSRIYVVHPDSPSFTAHMYSFYGYPPSLAAGLHSAIIEEPLHPSAAFLFFKRARQWKVSKRKELSKKLSDFYNKAQQDVKLNEDYLVGYSAQEAPERQLYAQGKLNYNYALVLDYAPEERQTYLKKAQEDFSGIRSIKRNKVEKYQRQIAHLLKGKERLTGSS